MRKSQGSISYGSWDIPQNHQKLDTLYVRKKIVLKPSTEPFIIFETFVRSQTFGIPFQ